MKRIIKLALLTLAVALLPLMAALIPVVVEYPYSVHDFAYDHITDVREVIRVEHFFDEDTGFEYERECFRREYKYSYWPFWSAEYDFCDPARPVIEPEA